jgi:hypothetical protein
MDGGALFGNVRQEHSASRKTEEPAMFSKWDQTQTEVARADWRTTWWTLSPTTHLASAREEEKHELTSFLQFKYFTFTS